MYQPFLKLAAISLFLSTLSPHVWAADIVSTWDGTTGNWSDASKWDTLDFPNNAAQTYEAILNSGTVTLDQAIILELLTQSGGTLTGSSDLTLTGTSTWSSGTQAGGSARTIVSSGATLDLDSSSSKFLSRALENSGTVNLTTTSINFGGLRFGSNSTDPGIVNNLAGGIFNASDDAGFSQNFGNSDHAFNNAGTFNKTGAGTTTSFSGVAFNNTGTVDVQEGTLRLSSDGTHTGNFTGAGDLNFNGGTHNINGGTYSVSGTTTFGGGNVTFDPAATISPLTNTVVSGGTVTFGQAVDITGLTQTGGTLTGSSDLTLTGTSTWSSGTQAGGSARTIVSSGATLDLDSSSSKFLSRALENSGTVNLTTTSINFGGLRFGSNSTDPGIVNNLAGGIFNASDDAGFSQNFGNSDHAFNNAGTFNKTGAGTTTSFSGVAFNNTGTVDVQEGTLRLSSDGTHTGNFTGAGDLNFNGGTHNINGGTYSVSGTTTFGGGNVTFDPAATISPLTNTVVSGGTVTFGQAVDITGLTQTGGTLTGSSDLTLTGASTWSAGTQEGGSGRTIVSSGATLDLDSSSSKFLSRALENSGTVNLTTTSINFGGLRFGSNSTDPGIVNNLAGGIFNASDDAGFSQNFGNSDHAFNNAGTFNKTGAGTTTSFSGVAFNNTGTVDVQEGTLRLSSQFTNYSSATNTLTGGTYMVASTLKFQNADINTNQAAITMDGPSAQIVNTSDVDALADLSLNDVGASFEVAGGNHFTTTAIYTNRGNTQVSGSTFTANAFINADSGILSGSGTVEIAGGGQTLTNNGVVAPGSLASGTGAGTLNITGDFTQGLLGTLQFEIGGLAAGSQFDQLLVSGAAVLAGSLDLAIIDGFAPEFGDSFTILDAGSLVGEFAGLPDGATLSADGVEFDISYLGGGSDVELTVSGFTLPADFNLDGDVDSVDLDTWEAGFGSGTLHVQGDANGDDDVDGGDFLTWQRNFGLVAPLANSSTTIPEPTSLLLTTFAACGLLMRRPAR